MNFPRALLALLSLLFPLSLIAKDSPETILESLPTTLAGCERGKIDSYGDPGLGQSASYRVAPLLITVYVYDLNQPKIADGIDDPLVRKAYAMAKEDILTAQQTKSYSSVDLLRDGKFSPREGVTVMRAQYHLAINNQGNDVRVYSEIHLFGARDHLVKLRCTCPREEEERCKPLIDAFAAALLEKLGQP